MAAGDAHKPAQTGLHATIDLLGKLQPSQGPNPDLAMPPSLLAVLAVLRIISDIHQSQIKFSGLCGARRASRELSRSKLCPRLVHARNVLQSYCSLIRLLCAKFAA